MEAYPKLTDEAMNMKKKLVTLVLGGMLAAALPLAADEWTDPDTGYTWTYQIYGETAEIQSSMTFYPTGALEIPSTLGGKPVTSIGSYVFHNCSGLTSVKIPDGVTNIENDAFLGCSGLTSVTIPDGVTSIGHQAFRDCSGLTSVAIPNSVTNVEDWAFEGCTGLRSVTVPECILDRGLLEYFSNHGSWGSREKFENLTEVIIADGVTYLPNSAFGDYSHQLSRISIPASVTRMDIRLNDGWNPSLEINIAPENPVYRFIDGMLIAYNEPPFYGGETVVVAGSLASGDVTIPDGVTRIASQAFNRLGGDRITSVKIPDSVTSIGWAAFDGCGGPYSPGVINVTIGCGVTNIEAYAFGGWNGLCGLTSVSVAPENAVYSSVNGMLLSKDGKTLIQGINGDVIVPNSVTSIGPYAFNSCSGLTSVTLLSSVTSIGNGAFFRCSGLTGAFAIPVGVTAIGDQTFEYCSGLTSVEIPDSVTSIGEDAFEGCGLTSVVIPDSVTSIGVDAFRECENLGSVVVGRNVARIGGNAFAYCGKLGKVTFRGNEPRFADYDDSEEEYHNQFYGVAPYCIAYLPRTATFNVDAGGGWCGMKAEYYDLEIAEPEPTSEPVPTPEPTLDPVTPGYEVIEATDITAPYEAPKAVTLHGVAYDGGDVLGIVELKLGKVNAKKKSSKVSGSFTGLDGKKIAIKAVNVTGVDSTAPVTVSLEVKGQGTMTVTIGGDKFAGSLGRWHVQSGTVGGNWTRGGAKVYVDVGGADGGGTPSLPAGTLEDLLPDGEPVVAAGGKWKFAKAASVKWAKPKKGAEPPEIYDEASGKGLIVDDTKGKTNLSGMKLTYTPKKGTFKGSFKLYALEGAGKATKLKKYTVKVSGVVVGGVGYGTAACKKPAVNWAMTVK